MGRIASLRKPNGRRRRLGRWAALAIAGGAAYLLIARRWRRAPGRPASTPDKTTPPGPRFSPPVRALIGAFNRVTLTFAGRRYSPYAMVSHVGRRSGQAYATPVVARPVGAGFVIPLPYGATVDWVRNLQAAGQGTVQWQGQRYAVGVPQVVGAAEGLPAFSPVQQWVCRRLGFTQFLRLPERETRRP
ncbi:MAG TPA: nitroreductase family deazaflavin-dependent oxidoreductase [Chloroflexia bacterium]|nr:nitroreductase family deazaflavin-dependent oxidoreductase [Chloroflexia bacterium]